MASSLVIDPSNCHPLAFIKIHFTATNQLIDILTNQAPLGHRKRSNRHLGIHGLSLIEPDTNSPSTASSVGCDHAVHADLVPERALEVVTGF